MSTAPLPDDSAAAASTQDIVTLDPVCPPGATAGAVESLPSIPGYEILGELGRGGMGVVYKARHLALKRVVALKMILAGEHAGSAQVRRFQTEAEAVARLQHPNIVQVHEVGEHNGVPFLSLEYCPGGSLAHKLQGNPLPPLEAARLVEALAQAVQAAHQAQIIHRDLKPANVLLAADGTPKITDFGLAKKLDEAGQTQTGAVMGTPSYMAPEQARGKTRELGPAADIYALGAILYELLTGRPPFKAATTMDTLLQVLGRDPVPIRLLNPSVNRDLETICLKCLEKDPQRRYPSARALAADLDRVLRGESISIRSVNVLDRLARALERSNLDVEFDTWGKLVLVWAGIVLATHVVSFTLIQSGLGSRLNWLCYIGQFLLMGVAYWQYQPGRRQAVSAAEHRLWSLWLGYVLACSVLPAVTYQLPGFDEPDRRWASYPISALLTGLAFVGMGSSWGRCYAFGVAFFALAVVMPARLDWASLEFGGLWTAVLVMIGLHLRRLGAEASRTANPATRESQSPSTTGPGPEQ